ncbi:MAG TPA: nitrilase-related carbon-nitrogen hydrolase [Streptosporangiales bacterium]
MVRIALAQVDCTLGDVDKNLERARRQVAAAAEQGAELVVFPELSLHGYALGEVVTDNSVRADDPRLEALTRYGQDVVVGFHEDGGIRRYDSAAYLGADGSRHVHRKLYLPTYLVWEERKFSSPGQSLRAYDTRFGRMATLVCYDFWQAPLPWLATQDGAEVLVVPVASAANLGPEAVDVIAHWTDLVRFVARMHQCWVVMCNRVGTEAGAQFWGGSRIVDPTGTVVAEAPLWESALVVHDVDVSAANRLRHAVPHVVEARLGLIGREVDRLIAAGADA